MEILRDKVIFNDKFIIPIRLIDVTIIVLFVLFWLMLMFGLRYCLGIRKPRQGIILMGVSAITLVMLSSTMRFIHSAADDLFIEVVNTDNTQMCGIVRIQEWSDIDVRSRKNHDIDKVIDIVDEMKNSSRKNTFNDFIKILEQKHNVTVVDITEQEDQIDGVDIIHIFTEPFTYTMYQNSL